MVWRIYAEGTQSNDTEQRKTRIRIVWDSIENELIQNVFSCWLQLLVVIENFYALKINKKSVIDEKNFFFTKFIIKKSLDFDN